MRITIKKKSVLSKLEKKLGKVGAALEHDTGMRIEMERGLDRQEAEKRVLANLARRSNYYTHLANNEKLKDVKPWPRKKPKKSSHRK